MHFFQQETYIKALCEEICIKCVEPIDHHHSNITVTMDLLSSQRSSDAQQD
jgi:hypothetical protein